MDNLFITLVKRIRLFWRRLVPRSLFARSLLILITPVLITQAIATFIFFDRHWDNMTRRLAEAVAGEISMIAEHIEEKVQGDESVRFITAVARELNLYISYEGNVEILPTVTKDQEWDSSVIETVEEAMQRIVSRPYNLYYLERDDNEWVVISVLLERGLLQVEVPEKRLFSSTAYIFLGWMIGASLLMMVIAIVFMRNQIKPIRRLAWAAERFGRGQDVPRLKTQGAREVRAASIAFREMHERLKRQIEQRTLMLAGVSHDLKTPITRMRLELSLMEDSDEKKALLQDLSEMERMIEGYLSFVQGEDHSSPENVDLTAFLTAIADKFKRNDQALEIALQRDLQASIRITSMERAINNVLSNAFKYADKAWLRAYMLGDMVEIVVEDNGPGIPNEKRLEVFRPFYRLDESRNLDSGGVGLGLSITKDIISRHGGEIFLENSNRGGLRVVMRLPV